MDYLKTKNVRDLHPGLILKKSLDLYKECRSSFKGPPAAFVTFCISALRHYLKRGFMPKETYMYGLWQSGRSAQIGRGLCSKNRMLKIQEYLNPAAWQLTTANKAFFYRYCQALNLPVPRLYGIFFPHSAGWSHTGSILKTQNDWITYIDTQLPGSFVIKPTHGAYGKGVQVYNKTGDGMFACGADRLHAGDIYHRMRRDPDYDSFLIQERLQSHADIARLSGSDNLQTARIITFIDRWGVCRLLYGLFKTIVGDNVIDNCDSGRTGNLTAEISLNQGILTSAIAVSPNGSGLKRVDRHPVTGVRFDGFQLPLWEEACALVQKAAVSFLPKRTIGWDMALTPEGVYILEGNGRYDPPLGHRRIAEFLSMLTDNADRHQSM